MSIVEQAKVSESKMIDQSYGKFLQAVLVEQNLTSAVEIYHHVRQIPYGFAGQRDPKTVYQVNRGTCSGKHLLLRDLLRAAQFEAETLCIFTHFNKGMPPHTSMPLALQRMINQELVSDFHNIVRLTLKRSERPLLLDATWNDRMADFGFPVNMHWAGRKDTCLAGEIIRQEEIREDLIVQKAELLESLSDVELDIRKTFLELLTGWISGLP